MLELAVTGIGELPDIQPNTFFIVRLQEKSIICVD